MWKLSLVILIVVNSVVAQNVDNKVSNSSNLSIKNSTQQKQEIRNDVISEKNTNSKEIHNETKISNNSSSNAPKLIDKDAELEPANPNGDLDADEFNFKYYWVILVGSSLAIIGLIIFKSFRLRRNRSEVRYGKANASDEIEPLDGRSKWDDVDSSENEDEIFDINFLKNTRLQKQSDM